MWHLWYLGSCTTPKKKSQYSEQQHKTFSRNYNRWNFSYWNVDPYKKEESKDNKSINVIELNGDATLNQLFVTKSVNGDKDELGGNQEDNVEKNNETNII